MENDPEILKTCQHVAKSRKTNAAPEIGFLIKSPCKDNRLLELTQSLANLQLAWALDLIDFLILGEAAAWTYQTISWNCVNKKDEQMYFVLDCIVVLHICKPFSIFQYPLFLVVIIAISHFIHYRYMTLWKKKKLLVKSHKSICGMGKIEFSHFLHHDPFFFSKSPC